MNLLERHERSTTSVSEFALGKTPTGFSAGYRARVTQEPVLEPQIFEPIFCSMYHLN